MLFIERFLNWGKKSGREIIDLTPYKAGMTPKQGREFDAAFKQRVGHLSETSQEYLADGLRALMFGEGKRLEREGEALVVTAQGRREATNELVSSIAPVVLEKGKVNPQTVERTLESLGENVARNLEIAGSVQNQRLHVVDRAIQNPPTETQKSVSVKGKGRSQEVTQTENSRPVLPRRMSTGGISIEYPSATIRSGASASVGDASSGVDHKSDGFNVHSSSHGNSAAAASGESVQINGGSTNIGPMDVDY